MICAIRAYYFMSNWAVAMNFAYGFAMWQWDSHLLLTMRGPVSTENIAGMDSVNVRLKDTAAGDRVEAKS